MDFRMTEYTGNYNNLMECFVRMNIKVEGDNSHLIKTQGIVFGDLKRGIIGLITPKFPFDRDVQYMKNITIFSNLGNEEFEFELDKNMNIDETPYLFFIELKDLELKEIKSQSIIVDKKRAYTPRDLSNLKYCDVDDFINRTFLAQPNYLYFCSFLMGMSAFAVQNYNFSILFKNMHRRTIFRDIENFSFISIPDIALYNGSPLIIEQQNSRAKIGGILVSTPLIEDLSELKTLKNTGILIEYDAIKQLIDSL